MKRLQPLLLLVASLCPLYGQSAHRMNIVLQRGGTTINAQVVPNARIQVCAAGTTCTPVTVYSDAALTLPLQQPIVADASGNYEYYVAPSCNDEIVSGTGLRTRVLPNVCVSNPEAAGGGGVNPGTNLLLPAYAVGGTNVGPLVGVVTDSGTKKNLSVTQGALSGLQTNGGVNSDLAGGIGALASSALCTSGCAATVPPNSADNTQAGAVSVPSGSSITDLRPGSHAYYHNPVSAHRFTLNNNLGNSATSISTLFDRPNQYLQYGSIDSLYINYAVQVPSVSIGNPPGSLHGLWNGGRPIEIDLDERSRGIFGGMSIAGTHSASGDNAIFNAEAQTAPGMDATSDEGFNLYRGLGGEITSWYQGTVTTGGTGVEVLPTTYTGGYGTTWDGGIMIDLTTKVPGIYYLVLGTAAPAASTAASQQTVSGITLTPTVARGKIPAGLQATANPNYDGVAAPIKTTTTVSVTNDFGVFPTGGVQNGCLTGGKPETVKFTAAAPSGGSQQITITYYYPHPGVGESADLWYGGPCGKFINSTIYTQTNTFGGTPNAIFVAGAMDANTIVYAWNKYGSTHGNYIRQYSYTTNLDNLTVSGSQVTAHIVASGQVNTGYVSSAPFAIVDSSASNASFNGLAQNVTNIISNGILTGFTWHFVGTPPTGTSTSAVIHLNPNDVDAFYLVDGAEIMAPMTTAGVPLAQNGVAWNTGDVVYSVGNGNMKMSAMSAVVNQETPADASFSVALNIGVGGRGVNEFMFPAYIRMANPCNWFVGCGGINKAPPMIYLDGFQGTALRTQHAPLNGEPVFQIGFDPQGDATRIINVLQAGGGNLIQYLPSPSTLFLGGDNMFAGHTQVADLTTGFVHIGPATSSFCGLNAYGGISENIGFVSNDNPATVWCKLSAGSFEVPSTGGIGGYNTSTLVFHTPSVWMTPTSTGWSFDTATKGNAQGTITALSGTLNGSPICTPANGSCAFTPTKGRANLVAGTATVSSTAANAGANFQLTNCALSGTAGLLSVGAVVNGTSFVINSANAADTSTVCWLIQ